MKNTGLLFFLFLCSSVSFATHNRAGEITYKRISAYEYEATIVTYTNIINTNADRDDLIIYWGDGDSSKITRTNGPDLSGGGNGGSNGIPDGEQISGDTKKNIYIGRHTYPGASNYWISMQDPNRNIDILNIPNSVGKQFYIRSLLVVNNILGQNSSPILLNPPIDNACFKQCFFHNPSAYDIDGDSLSYELTDCLESGIPITGYTYPNVVGGGTIKIDAFTGELSWCSPQKIGSFNVAILIKEWRSGIQIGSILRDMQITVVPCENVPPEIANSIDTCIEAGKLLKFGVAANDGNNDIVTLTATGGPLDSKLLTPTAVFNSITGQVPITNFFSWQTECNHVRSQPYMITFKADDNHLPPPNLVDFQTVSIKVVASAPKNPSASPSGSTMIINWSAQNCSFTSSNNVIGYKIYRHMGYTGWKHGACEIGVPDYTGYSLIGSTQGVSSTTFIDNNDGQGLIHGTDYCYMIVACYADGSLSYATNEFCNKLVRDVPIITNVSVDSTDSQNGSINIKWIKPTANVLNFDTILNSGPYEFRLMQAEGVSGNLIFNEIARFSNPNFALLNVNSYTITALNTDEKQFTYRIDFFANGILKGSTHTASSIYLTSVPNDNQLTLSWQQIVPWSNYKYKIYRKNTSSVYVLIDSTSNQTYIDKNLKNGEEYCYKIESFGNYTDTTILSPLINLSQEKCDVPKDLTPPCPPEIFFGSNCEISQDTIIWTNPNHSCSDDVVYYNLYYSSIKGDKFELLTSIKSLLDTTFIYKDSISIAGCFVVTAVDSFKNESVFSKIVCADNCPNYSLPNVFTPNDDKNNDLFIPFPYRYIKDISLKIYDRWGLLVFETSNPKIEWDGKNMQTKKACMDGVYYYSCEVREIRVNGIVPKTINGFIQLFRNK